MSAIKITWQNLARHTMDFALVRQLRLAIDEVRVGDARRVIICGNSLFLLAIEDSLRLVPTLEVTRVNLHLPTATARVAALEPDVVIVERSNGAGDLALELLHAQPGLAVIGVDVTRSVLTVFSSHQVAANGLDDLVQAIEQASQEPEARVITRILSE